MEAQADQLVERVGQVHVRRRDRDARRDLHPALGLEQGPDPREDAVVTARPVAEGSQEVVLLAGPVEADRHGEAVVLEELGVRLGQEGAVGGDRERTSTPRCRPSSAA